MQRWLKRAGLILFFGLWAAAGLQIWAKKQESREMEAVAAFSNIGTDNRSGIVQYYGKLKKEKQVQMLERREEYLRQIAASLGISSQILVYRTYGEDSQSVVLQKEGANADTVLRLVTWREKGAITGQSLYANVTIPGGGFEEAQTLRTKMQNVLDETMESKRSSVAVQGFYLGNLSEEKKEAIAETAAGRYACQNRDQKPGWEFVYGLCLQSLFFGECKAGDNPGKSGTDHVLQQQDAADRNMCGSSGNRSERGKCLIICRRLRMIKRIVSSDNCSMHCQANKNAGIMRDLCALQAGDYEDRRDYVYRRNHI